MFSEPERRFLSREYAALGLKEFPAIDESTLRNKTESLRVINRIMEKRASVLGRQFAEFRNLQSGNQPDDLETRIAGAKLF